jgi:hypothetical protein
VLWNPRSAYDPGIFLPKPSATALAPVSRPVETTAQ